MNSPNWIEKPIGFSPSFWKEYFKKNVHLLSKAGCDFQPMISYVWLTRAAGELSLQGHLLCGARPCLWLCLVAGK